MATIYIDREPYEVKEGRNLLQACLSLGFDLPYFCWHPAMHSVGACRQCAVKVFKDEHDTKGKIVMSCMTPAADGTHLSIEDPEARYFRASVIEWLMTNHPHDCPVCDEGGECHLQDMTVMTGHVYRRYRFKKRTHRNQDLGPFVNHEMNRCIACYRCVRFYNDYAGGRDFGVFHVHHYVYFGRHSDGVLESEFSGNLVEVCPTGVFTDKTLKKHYTRKWDLQTAPSVCVHCSIGCNTIPGERYGTLRRIRNRFNGEVNGYFLCDRGRYGYEFVNSGERMRRPLLRSRGVQEPVTKEKMLVHITDILSSKARGIIGIGSPTASLESNYLLRSLVGPEHFFSGVSDRDFQLTGLILDILRTGPARSPSLADMASADAVFVLGEDLTNTAPMAALALRQSVRQVPMEIPRKLHIPPWDDTAVREAIQERKGPLYIASARAGKLDGIATRIFRGAPADIARLGFAVAQILDPSAPDVMDLSAEMKNLAGEIAGALAGAKRPLVISGMSAGCRAMIRAAAQTAWALCAKSRPAGLSFILAESNSLGLGLLGGRPVREALETLRSGSADTVILLENSPERFLDGASAEVLFGAKHAIAIDYLPHRWLSGVEAVLPAAVSAEATGTLVNNEGRAQRFYRVYLPEGDILESWRWLLEILEATGRTGARAVKSFDDVLAAMAEALPVFRPVEGLSPPAEFRVAGLRIPRQPHRYSGRTAMHANMSIHEPAPPEDGDSPFSFSMEGFEGRPPPALIPRFWAPAWNSVQSVNKFQEEVGGTLRGGDPGKRLIEPPVMGGHSYFKEIPGAFRSREDALRVVPVHHIFGSERLSALASGISVLVPEPYLALNPADAEKVGAESGMSAELSLPAGTLRLSVRIDPSLPSGVAGLPVGLAGLEGVQVPDWGTVKIAGTEEKT